MPCKEAEAVRFLLKEHLAQISVAKTHLAGIRNGTRDTECLQALPDGSRSIRSFPAALLDRDGCAHSICPARILKTDRLDLLYLLINVKPSVFGNLLRFLDRSDTIAV